jgi:membrane associated rhomboid family serine protease
MTRWVSLLIATNVVVFILQQVFPAVTEVGLFVPAWVVSRPWTPLTAMFLHDPSGFGHIGFNMLGLYMFGPRVESRFGGKRFLGLYFASGLVGAAACFIQPHQAVIGASGAIFGVALAYARYWPKDMVLVFFVIPMTMRTMVTVYTLWSVLGALHLVQAQVAHLGHLGGFAGGYLFCLWMERFTGARNFRQRAETGWTVGQKEAVPVPKVIVELATGEKESLERWARIQPDQLHPVNREELERIRAKIVASGVRSLTALEREFLERFAALVT